MAKIVLTIDESYCADWDFFCGVRDLLQNAKDAEEFELRKMTVKHLPRTNTLVITTADTALSASLLLLLGASTKRGTGQRGQFGEGFAIACLALTRAGHNITIYNGEEVWRPEIALPDEGHPFEGSKLLVFNTRKLQTPRKDFSVEIENVSKEVWDATQKLFLFLRPPKAAEAVEVNDGTVLLADEYQGMIFSRGIFVTRKEDVQAGYDIKYLKLDRDRRSAEDWDLQYRLGIIWQQANVKEPAKFAPKIYQMAKEDKAEVKSLHYHADAELIKHLHEAFEGEHGVGTVAVTTMAESRELESLGAKTAVVNKTLKDLLDKSGPKIEEIKAKLKSQVTCYFSWSDLTPEEAAVCTQWLEKITKDYRVVTFNDPTTTSRWLEESNTVGVSRAILQYAPRDLVLIVATQESRRRGVDPTQVLLDVLFAT